MEEGERERGRAEGVRNKRKGGGDEEWIHFLDHLKSVLDVSSNPQARSWLKTRC